MSDIMNDWIVADSEDEDASRPLQIVDKNGLLNGTSVSTGPDKILQRQEFFKLCVLYRMLTGHGFAASLIQTASFITSQARTPQRGREPLDISDTSLFTPPPGYQDYNPPNASPLLPRGTGTPVPKSKPRPRPVPRKSRTTSTIYDDFVRDDESRSSTSLIGSASAIPASILTTDSIHPPTTPSAISEAIEEVDPAFSIADRAKTRARKTQAKKPTYVPVSHDVIELTSDSDLDELSLKPPRKRQKSQEKPVKPKPRPKPRPKPKARTSPSSPKVAEQSTGDTQPSDFAFPSPAGPALPTQLSSTISRLPSFIPPLPDLSSPLSSPEITRRRKTVSPFHSEVHGKEMDVDVPDASSSFVMPPPLSSAPLSPVVPPIDDSHTVEGQTGDADIITAASKGKKKDTKLSSRAKGKKKSRKQADKVELDNLAHNLPTDEPAACNTALEDNNLVEKQESKVTSKNALPKPTPIVKSKSKPQPKGKRKAVLSESEDEDDEPPRSRSPTQGSHLPQDEDSRGEDLGKDSEIIAVPEITNKISPQSVVTLPKQTPAATLKSRAFTIKSKSTPMSELIRRVNSQPNSPFSNSPSYSPLVKSSRMMLSRIAPLHPNRRAPPPPLPRPPPPKKSKKQIEMEERIEEELSETVEGWSCMTDEERRNLRRARIDAELGYE
ncbi:uncharacterized protein EDB93DRAFT_1254083 [Suillus bovinus]|uniref:uncharacterized protein n=1 Tax=Suillus bovinus TaxID=48563 RepID=UPI001B86FAD5|nr:uncharacterized protein EDB93DRAFT_1254083 [Suillus bovinus]KAG2136097.1 hypothetical protein EDB93DRAFT_1254083 [Suillus bovinus]